MGIIRRKYDEEFKRSAVKLVEEEGRQIVDVAKNLGISKDLLYRWRREYLGDPKNAFPGQGHLKPLEEELRKTQKQLKDVTMERDILKKAIAIFSKPQK